MTSWEKVLKNASLVPLYELYFKISKSQDRRSVAYADKWSIMNPVCILDIVDNTESLGFKIPIQVNLHDTSNRLFKALGLEHSVHQFLRVRTR